MHAHASVKQNRIDGPVTPALSFPWINQMAKTLFIALCVFGYAFQACSPQSNDDPTVGSTILNERKCVTIDGLKTPSNAKVKIWLDEALADDPPLAGKSFARNGQLIFQPRFPLLAGIYRVEVTGGPNKTPVKLPLKIIAESMEPTEIKSVFPSADVIPENTLKFYVHFEGPMRKGDIYQFVKLREVGGKDVKFPFLEIEQEFWSRDSKRLTLLLDPGRIKRGLKPRKEMGPIFEAGKTYELVISGDWPDAQGTKLNGGQNFVRRFKIEKEDHKQPTIEDWKVIAPKAGTKSPLELSFPESLDEAMLQRSILVFQTGKDEPLDGEIKVAKHETNWKLVPTKEWVAGDYQIEVDPNLEDLCGNSIGRQFDVDIFNKTESTKIGKMKYLKFSIKSAENE